LPPLYQESITNGIIQIRALRDQERNIKNQLNILEKNPRVIRYEENISISSKYSIGNCYELAAQALDYVLHQVTNNINAELFCIKNGDHAFLVLNRDLHSNPADPNSWGEGAVICDPLSNKVYQAYKYLSFLAKYFDPNKHEMKRMQVFNSKYLRKERDPNKLKINLLFELVHVVKTLDRYANLLGVEKDRLAAENNAEQNQKILVLVNKIASVNEAARSTIHLGKYMRKSDEDLGDYRSAKAELQEILRQVYKNALSAIEFSQEEKLILFTHQGQDIKTKMMNFFGSKTETKTHIEKVEEEINAYFKKRF
jgi:hypothetical protein